MKKINLLGQASSGSSESTTITNLGLIYLKPLLDIEPTRETQELFPGDDGVSGYSFIRIKGVNESMQEKEVNPSTSKQVITPDASYLGLEQVTISAVDKNIDANIKSDNIKSGVTILGVEGAYHPITKPIEITPSTDEQTEVPDMGVDGFDSVTVHAVTSDIDSNIKSENIIKGVSILGVEGNLDLKPEETTTATYSKAGNYSITPTDGKTLSSVDVTIKELDLPDQLRYDLATRTDGSSSPTFKKEFSTDFTEDGDTYFLFCNEQADIANNLVGFGYFTSYVTYSYHTYDESYFKIKDGFVYLNVTKLGGASNSSGISITYQFKDHKIPAKCLYNCGSFGGISIGATCQDIGQQAFWLEDKYCDFKRKYLKAHSNNSAAGYGTAYSLRTSMFNSDIYNTIEIGENIYTDYDSFKMVLSEATVHNTYSGNGEERPATDTASTLKYRFRIGFFDEYSNGLNLNYIKGMIYSVNDDRSKDVYLYKKDFNNRVGLGTDENVRSMYIYSDTPFNNAYNFHVYFFFNDNNVTPFAFYADQHKEEYFLNNSYLLNVNTVNQFAYGQVAQYPQPEFPESVLNGIYSWVNLYNNTGKDISLRGVQNVKVVNSESNTIKFNDTDSVFIGNCTINALYLDKATDNCFLAGKLVSDKDSKPTFMANVIKVLHDNYLSSYYTKDNRYIADCHSTATKAYYTYATCMNKKACSITNMDDIIVGENVRYLTIKFGGDNCNPYRLFLLSSNINNITLEKDGDLTHTDIELVVPGDKSYDNIKSKLEEIGYTVTVKTISTSDFNQDYFVTANTYGQHTIIKLDSIDFNNTDNYHIYHQYSGSAQATDDTDSSYVDITVYKYKRILANYDITNQIIGVYSLSSNDTGLIWQYGTDVNSNYKIVVHDSKTYMYCTHVHDSSSGGLIWLMFKDDNQTIPDFGFYGIDNLQTIKIQKTVNLGCAAYFSDITQNNYKNSFTSLVPIKVRALSLFGFKNINLITNYYNYAAAYATNSLYVINVTGNYNSGDESQSINSKGLITVDLSGNYFPGNFTNSNYNNFSGPNEIRNVSYLEGSLTRKWMNNNLYDTVNYIDSNPGGNHLFELDLPEQPLLFGSQNLSLTKLGMTINGTRILPEWSKACYNLMISHNIGTFECTFGLDNIYNIVNKTINICIFCDPSKVTFNHSTDSPLSSDYVINIYTNDEYSDLDALKTMMNTNFSGITVNYDTFTVVYDTLQNQTLESGHNYGFVHSSRTRHSLLKL